MTDDRGPEFSPFKTAVRNYLMGVRECEAIAIPRWIHREKLQKKEHRNCRNVVLIQGQGGDAAGIDSGGGGDGSCSNNNCILISSLSYLVLV